MAPAADGDSGDRGVDPSDNCVQSLRRSRRKDFYSRQTAGRALNLFFAGGGGRDSGGFWPQISLSAVAGKD